MSELRWTLLILGVVFIAALSWWERRRPRQAFAPRLREASLGHAGEPRTDRQERSAGPGTAAPEGPVRAEPRSGGTGARPEPWIGDSGLADAALSDDVALTDAADEPEPGEDGAMRADRARSAPGPLEELPMLVIPDEDEQVALKAAWDEAPPEPTLIDPEADGPAAGGQEQSAAVSTPAPEVGSPETIAAPPDPRAGPIAAAGGSETEIPGAEGVGAVRIVEPEAPGGDGAAAVEPIVDWPPEDSRRIVALRLIAPQPERFAGRALRLALAAEGFLLGKFAIFHKPDEANRAVLSAASLTRPGAFDLETMDSQRYAGLSLFAVLPGPKSPRQAFEELLATARNLNERLQGALQDERGGPLTPLRVAAIRESLKSEAAGAAAAAAHET